MRGRLVDVLDDSRSVLLGSWPMRPFSWLLVGMLVNLVGDVSAEDEIYLKKSSNPTAGKIIQVDEKGVHIQLSGTSGEVAFPLSGVDRAEVEKPPVLAAGFNALKNGKNAEAIQVFEPIRTKYRGVPDEWIGRVTFHLGEAYLTSEDWVKAGECFSEFRKFYSKSDSCDIAATHEAEALFKSSQTSTALKLLEELMSRKEKDVSLNDEQNAVLGKASVILGHCYLANNKTDQALESFLKTTTLYYMDKNAVAEAQYQSALLFEKMNNTLRARGQLEELLKESPHSPFASEAKKKLDFMKARALPSTTP